MKMADVMADLDEIGSSFEKLINPIFTKHFDLLLNDDDGEFKEILLDYISSILDQMQKKYKLQYRMNNLFKMKIEPETNFNAPQNTDGNVQMKAEHKNESNEPAKADFCLPSTSTQTPKQTDFQLKYYCAYCKYLESAEYHSNVDQVYVHWKKVHRNGSPGKPFRFTVGQMQRPKGHIVKLTDKVLAILRGINPDQNDNLISKGCVEIHCGYHGCNWKVGSFQFPVHFVKHFIPMNYDTPANVARIQDIQRNPEKLNECFRRSRVIFENGLVLIKDNLINTKENDFDRIEGIIASHAISLEKFLAQASQQDNSDSKHDRHMDKIEKTDDKGVKRLHETANVADGPSLKLRCLDESISD